MTGLWWSVTDYCLYWWSTNVTPLTAGVLVSSYWHQTVFSMASFWFRTIEDYLHVIGLCITNVPSNSRSKETFQCSDMEVDVHKMLLNICSPALKSCRHYTIVVHSRVQEHDSHLPGSKQKETPIQSWVLQYDYADKTRKLSVGIL